MLYLGVGGDEEEEGGEGGVGIYLGFKQLQAQTLAILGL
jgi:hypothetical protein